MEEREDKIVELAKEFSGFMKEHNLKFSDSCAIMTLVTADLMKKEGMNLTARSLQNFCTVYNRSLERILL